LVPLAFKIALHLTFLSALVIAGIGIRKAIREGRLRGRQRTWLLLSYGCFALAWVVKTLAMVAEAYGQ
jgi:hypothetical protein